MSIDFSSWPLQRRLALLALALGVLAVFLGDPYHGGRAVVDAKELALSVGQEDDHITVQELADWLIQERWDYRLIDVRGEAEFAEYHIPTAANVPLVGLSEYPLLRNEKVIFYSNGGIHAVQASFLLKAQGFRAVYTLLGGLDAWKNEILFPALPANATPEQQMAFEQAKAVAKHFGGTPRTGTSEEPAMQPQDMPKLEAPAQLQPVPRQRKAREGC